MLVLPLNKIYTLRFGMAKAWSSAVLLQGYVQITLFFFLAQGPVFESCRHSQIDFAQAAEPCYLAQETVVNMALV